MRNVENSGTAFCNSVCGEEYIVNLFVLSPFLFLPAAGQRKSDSISQDGKMLSYWTASSYDVNQAWRVLISAGGFDANSYNSRFWGWSIRLARVVSEGLTQTWKCHIVFGIGCHRLSF